jgi:mono/diheme cytochrome c family protein
LTAGAGASAQEPPAAGSPQEPPLAAAPQDTAEPDPAVELFVAKCASCHTVGKGIRVGPDLAGAHERRTPAWLHEMIRTPSNMLGRDADARKLLVDFNNVRMPDLGLTSEQVDELIALITRCSAEPCDLAGKLVPVTEATPQDVARGEALFTGRERTMNGSVACISCHEVGGLDTFVPGGTLAVDLTHVFARLGDEGLDAALKNPSFLLMNKVFADHPLDPQEAFALRAFLYEANKQGAPPRTAASLPLFSVLVTVVVLLVLNAFWRRRLRGVRRAMTRPQEITR